MKNATDSIAVIIVAGGSGARMGARLPKQFLPLDGRPVLMHTVQRFADALPQSRIVVVLPSSHIEYWDKLCRRHGFAVPHIVCTGGANRFESVSNGLRHAGEAELIAVHDGVRPLVSREIIERATEDTRTYGAVIPVVRPIDSMRRIDRDGSRIVDRSLYRIVQTPQVFRADILRNAYARPFDERFTDDASVVEAAGQPVYLCEGSYENIKITTPVDMLTAEALLAQRQRTSATAGE